MHTHTYTVGRAHTSRTWNIYIVLFECHRRYTHVCVGRARFLFRIFQNWKMWFLFDVRRSMKLQWNFLSHTHTHQHKYARRGSSSSYKKAETKEFQLKNILSDDVLCCVALRWWWCCREPVDWMVLEWWSFIKYYKWVPMYHLLVREEDKEIYATQFI